MQARGRAHLRLSSGLDVGPKVALGAGGVVAPGLALQGRDSDTGGVG